MQASERARELERVYQSRRGHAPQLSISDDSHHVTEAIGDLYGDDDHYAPSKRSSRPLSFISSPLGDNLNLDPHEPLSPFDPFSTAPPPKSPLRAQMMAASDKTDKPSVPKTVNGNLAVPDTQTPVARNNTPISPPLSRTNSDTATQQFPLNDIDYESSAAGLAQELSNLQAIRRMSMDVNTSDPDLPSFKSFTLPTVAPQNFSEDEDPSKLFWVPARLHPELAPKEFKTFIEEKVDTIRRRSGDADSLSPDGMGRQGSSGGLRRKKSMLSRQIDSPNEYRDGADRLERKRSDKNPPNGGLADLQELENIVEDPANLMRRMSLGNSDGEVPHSEDMPILPSAPIGPGTLKRSTRTTYRRGSLRKERVPFSRRLVTRQAETDTEESPASSPTQAEYDMPSLGLVRVQSEPVNPPENFSRPTRKRSPPLIQRPGSADDLAQQEAVVERRASQAKPFHSRIASNGRTTAPLPGYDPQQHKQQQQQQQLQQQHHQKQQPPPPPQVPQIIETPPPQEPRRQQMPLPERNSSRGPPPANAPHPPPGPRPQPKQQLRHPPPRNQQSRDRHASPIKPSQTMEDLVSHPAALPGNSTRTDTLSIIPNLPEEKKSEKKGKKDEGGSRKTSSSWGWLLGGEEKNKKESEDREKEAAKKVKNKLSKSVDKSHDNTRLDVLQTSIDATNGRGRESVVLDRESVKLEEERKKESTRKLSGEAKKEKETGLFSSIFGGGKKKGEKDSSSKKGSSTRGLSPEPPPRILKPDIDYNWTRFSILEERAIYRMAHIKLANPRRELYSQVLLSNFMYSYLAKVQQMHPQIQIGTSKQARLQQKQQAAEQQQQQRQEQQQQQKKDQSDDRDQYQRYQQDGRNGHIGDNRPASRDEDDSNRPESRDSQHSQQSQHSQHGQQPRDSHHSSHGKSNGQYSVASGQSYLGHSGGGVGGGGKQQPYYDKYDDSDQSSRDDDMW